MSQLSLSAAFPVPGQIIDRRYRIDRVLSESGGMGLLVAARQINLGTHVAIKFLRPEKPDPKRANPVDRFLNEAQLASQLTSEHVVRVFDYGQLPSGMPYMAMELLKGNDLSLEVKSKGPLPLALAIDYFLQACEGIAEAHARGIVHRDLKPANLFLTKRPDGSPLVKVLDFGISKIADPDGDYDSLTKSAQDGFFSFPYAPPEQLRSFKTADQRADQWALGVVLHYLLTGVLPFKGNTLEQLAAVISSPPIALREHAPDLPEELENIILRCLEKNPKQRYDDLAALAASLEPFTSPHAKRSIESIAETFRTQQPMEPLTRPMAPPPRVIGIEAQPEVRPEPKSPEPSDRKDVVITLMIATVIIVVSVALVFAKAMTGSPAPAPIASDPPSVSTLAVSATEAITTAPPSPSGIAPPKPTVTETPVMSSPPDSSVPPQFVAVPTPTPPAPSVTTGSSRGRSGLPAGGGRPTVPSATAAADIKLKPEDKKPRGPTSETP